MAYIESGMVDKALEIGNLMDSDNHIPAATGIVRARAFFALGMPEAGLAEGELAVSQGAENVYLLIEMALAYARAGDGPNALRMLARINDEEAPGTLDNYQVRCGKATVQLILSRHDEAIAVTEKLVEEFGEDENLLNMLGIRYMLRDRTGDKLRARRYFDKALEHSRDDLTLTNRAILLAEAGATRDALEMTREALRVAKTAPRSPLTAWVVPLNLARHTAQLGDVAGARKLLTELLEDESIPVPDWVAMSAHQQLEELEKGVDDGGPGVLPPVSGSRYAELAKREQRQTVRLFERLVCDECEKHLGWHSCEAEYTVPGLGDIGDLDVYGFATEDSEEVVCVGECKLRFEGEDPVDYGEMNQLVNGKLEPLREFMDTRGDNKPLRGFFFANAHYDEEALELAHETGVRIFKVSMSRGWRRRDDWKIRLEELEG